jgi:hypothetical protein
MQGARARAKAVTQARVNAIVNFLLNGCKQVSCSRIFRITPEHAVYEFGGVTIMVASLLGFAAQLQQVTYQIFRPRHPQHGSKVMWIFVQKFASYGQSFVVAKNCAIHITATFLDAAKLVVDNS